MNDNQETPPASEINEYEKKKNSMQNCWAAMTFYERYEQIVLIILSAIISLVVLFALLQLIVQIYVILMEQDILSPMDYKVFQVIFGMIMTLLIAMEFKHSIIKILKRNSHIIQVKAIILLALLALARKFIIINFETTEPFQLIALSFSVLVLGLVYWLLNQQENQLDQ